MLTNLQGRARELRDCAEKLSRRHRYAVIKYLEHGNKSQALKEAKFPKNTKPNEIFNDPLMITYIRLVREYLAGADLAGPLEVQRFYTETMRNQKIDIKTRLKAGELMGRCLGMFEKKNESELKRPLILINDLDEIGNDDEEQKQLPQL